MRRYQDQSVGRVWKSWMVYVGNLIAYMAGFTVNSMLTTGVGIMQFQSGTMANYIAASNHA